MSCELGRVAGRLRASVFATLADKLAQMPEDGLRLHIGDTYRLPPMAARLDRMEWEARTDWYKYSHPFGDRRLLEALVQKLANKNGLQVAPDNLQVTCGATHGLACCALTVLNPGDEVLVLAPYWPLITGIITSAGGTARAIPFSKVLLRDPGVDIAALLEAYVTDKTKALYFANPNNPDGLVYTREQLSAIAEFAQAKGLWVWSDEAYEDYIYDGLQHLSIASLPGMEERTFSVFTFSKSYAMAGCRLGYVVGPADSMITLRRISNHTVYNIASAIQACGLAALKTGEPFIEESRHEYQKARDILLEVIGDLCCKPQGGAYCFLEMPDEKVAWQFLYRALDADLALAPGEAFGDDFKHCLRICFTAAPLNDIKRAAELLLRLRREFGV